MKKNKNKNVGYGFFGRWNSGEIGWSAPTHISGMGRRHPDRPTTTDWNKEQPHYLCKVTIELVKNKKGFPITRYLK